jgi:multiple sugar transport system permease protein
MFRMSRAFWLILPGLLLTALVIGLPILILIWTAFHEVSRFGVLLSFNGLANFADVFADPLFYAALLRTILWTAAVVLGTLLLSLPVALILNEDFAGRGFARLLILLPWSVSLTMTAVVWRWALNGQSGLFNHLLLQLGIIDTPIEWLGTAPLAFTVQIAIAILVSIPFTVTLLLGGLSSIAGDVYEAGAVDGATGWKSFRHITLPLLKPFVNIAIVLNVIYVFNSFPIIWVLTQGGPADGTDILVTYLYKLAFKFGQLGKASVVSLMMFAVLLIFTIVYAALQMRREEA